MTMKTEGYACSYYDKQLAPALEQMKVSIYAPAIQMAYNSEKGCGASHHMSINMDSLDALERFIMEARIILNRKASDVLDKEFGTITPNL